MSSLACQGNIKSCLKGRVTQPRVVVSRSSVCSFLLQEPDVDDVDVEFESRFLPRIVEENDIINMGIINPRLYK